MWDSGMSLIKEQKANTVLDTQYIKACMCTHDTFGEILRALFKIDIFLKASDLN